MRAQLSTLCLLTVLVTGCSGSDEYTDPGASTKGADGHSSQAPTATTSAAAHAVPPPGARTGALVPPDLLVFAKSPLGDRLTAQITDLPEVDRVEPLSLANVSVDDRVLTVAAVSPATYRNFTSLESAEFQEQWDRVAQGEVSISEKLGNKLADQRGFLTLGNEADAPTVHIGAFAPQIPQIDAVVNERWGKSLGMPMGNAMLVSTGINSPRSVMKRLESIVGDAASVSILGPDLDPGAHQTAVLTGGSVAAAVGTFRYTVRGHGRIAPEKSWVAANIRTEDVPILGTVTCHRAMLPQLRAALAEVDAAGLADEIHPEEYAGCYYPRYIEGTQQLSLHTFGIALDLNVPGNQRGTKGEMSRAVVAIFKKWGFAWGGNWAWTDPMHFEMNRLVSPE